jgi:hypothetical protein
MRVLLGMALLLAGCAFDTRIHMPVEVGPWRLESNSLLGPANAPPRIGNQRVWASVESVYSGPTRVEVHVHRFRTNAEAFEALQRLQVQPGTMPFQTGNLLVIPQAGDRSRLEEFANALRPLLQ